MRGLVYLLTTLLISYCFAAPFNPQFILEENVVEGTFPDSSNNDDSLLSMLAELTNIPLNMEHVLWVKNKVMPRLDEFFEDAYTQNLQTLHPAHENLMDALEKLFSKPEVQRLIGIIVKPITNVNRFIYDTAKGVTEARLQLILHHRLLAIKKYLLSTERQDEIHFNLEDREPYGFSLTQEIMIYIHEANEAQLLLMLFASMTSPLEQLYKEWEMLQRISFLTIEEIMAFIKRGAVLLRFRNLQTKFPSHEAGSNEKRKASPNVCDADPVESSKSLKSQKLTEKADSALGHKEVVENLALFHNLIKEQSASWPIENDEDTLPFLQCVSGDQHIASPTISDPLPVESCTSSSHRELTDDVDSNKIVPAKLEEFFGNFMSLKNWIKGRFARWPFAKYFAPYMESSKVDPASKFKKLVEELMASDSLINKKSASWPIDNHMAPYKDIKRYIVAIADVMDFILELSRSFEFVQTHFDRYIEASLVMARFNVYQFMIPYLEFLKPYEFLETALQSYESIFMTMEEIGQVLENRMQGVHADEDEIWENFDHFFHHIAWLHIQDKYMKMICKTQKEFFKLERKPSVESLKDFIQWNWKNVVRIEICPILLEYCNPRFILHERIMDKVQNLKSSRISLEAMKDFCRDIGKVMYIDLPGLPCDIAKGYVEFLGNPDSGSAADNNGFDFNGGELEKEFGMMREIPEHELNLMPDCEKIHFPNLPSEMRDFFDSIITGSSSGGGSAMSESSGGMPSPPVNSN